MTRASLYLRVSTAEQVKGMSLATQGERWRAWAVGKGAELGIAPPVSSGCAYLLGCSRKVQGRKKAIANLTP